MRNFSRSVMRHYVSVSPEFAVETAPSAPPPAPAWPAPPPPEVPQQVVTSAPLPFDQPVAPVDLPPLLPSAEAAPPQVTTPSIQRETQPATSQDVATGPDGKPLMYNGKPVPIDNDPTPANLKELMQRQRKRDAEVQRRKEELTSQLLSEVPQTPEETDSARPPRLRRRGSADVDYIQTKALADQREPGDTSPHLPPKTPKASRESGQKPAVSQDDDDESSEEDGGRESGVLSTASDSVGVQRVAEIPQSPAQPEVTPLPPTESPFPADTAPAPQNIDLASAPADLQRQPAVSASETPEAPAASSPQVISPELPPAVQRRAESPLLDADEQHAASTLVDSPAPAPQIQRDLEPSEPSSDREPTVPTRPQPQPSSPMPPPAVQRETDDIRRVPLSDEAPALPSNAAQNITHSVPQAPSSPGPLQREVERTGSPQAAVPPQTPAPASPSVPQDEVPVSASAPDASSPTAVQRATDVTSTAPASQTPASPLTPDSAQSALTPDRTASTPAPLPFDPEAAPQASPSASSPVVQRDAVEREAQGPVSSPEAPRQPEASPSQPVVNRPASVQRSADPPQQESRDLPAQTTPSAPDTGRQPPASPATLQRDTESPQPEVHAAALDTPAAVPAQGQPPVDARPVVQREPAVESPVEPLMADVVPPVLPFDAPPSSAPIQPAPDSLARSAVQRDVSPESGQPRTDLPAVQPDAPAAAPSLPPVYATTTDSGIQRQAETGPVADGSDLQTGQQPLAAPDTTAPAAPRPQETASTSEPVVTRSTPEPSVQRAPVETALPAAPEMADVIPPVLPFDSQTTEPAQSPDVTGAVPVPLVQRQHDDVSQSLTDWPEPAEFEESSTRAARDDSTGSIPDVRQSSQPAAPAIQRAPADSVPSAPSVDIPAAPPSIGAQAASQPDAAPAIQRAPADSVPSAPSFDIPTATPSVAAPADSQPDVAPAIQRAPVDSLPSAPSVDLPAATPSVGAPAASQPDVAPAIQRAPADSVPSAPSVDIPTVTPTVAAPTASQPDAAPAIQRAPADSVPSAPSVDLPSATPSIGAPAASQPDAAPAIQRAPADSVPSAPSVDIPTATPSVSAPEIQRVPAEQSQAAPPVTESRVSDSVENAPAPLPFDITPASPPAAAPAIQRSPEQLGDTAPTPSVPPAVETRSADVQPPPSIQRLPEVPEQSGLERAAQSESQPDTAPVSIQRTAEPATPVTLPEMSDSASEPLPFDAPPLPQNRLPSAVDAADRVQRQADALPAAPEPAVSALPFDDLQTMRGRTSKVQRQVQASEPPPVLPFDPLPSAQPATLQREADETVADDSPAVTTQKMDVFQALVAAGMVPRPSRMPPPTPQPAVQRSPLRDANLEQFAARESGRDVESVSQPTQVQRAVTVEEVTSSVDQPSQSSQLDVDKLAKDVMKLLRNKLRSEAERISKR